MAVYAALAEKSSGHSYKLTGGFIETVEDVHNSFIIIF